MSTNFENFTLMLSCEKDEKILLGSDDPEENLESIVAKISWILMMLLKRVSSDYRQEMLTLITMEANKEDPEAIPIIDHRKARWN